MHQLTAERLQSNLSKYEEQPSSMARKNLQTYAILKKPSESVIENGVNGLDLIASPEVEVETFTKAMAVLQANYGTEYSREKVALLFDMIRDEGWSQHRFQRTFRWFLKNKPFASWTISDWFSHSVKLYPHEWYLMQCKEGVKVIDRMDIYELPNKTWVYKWKDGIDLPLPKVELVNGKYQARSI